MIDILDLENQILNGDFDDIIGEVLTAIKEEGWEVPDLQDALMPVAKALVYLCSLIFYDEFHYPQPQKGTYDIADNTFEKLKWVYRYWLNQLEVAEKNSGIAEFLRKQDLNFNLPEGFIQTAKTDLACAGDLLAVDVLTYENTPHLFDAIKEFYLDADITCANLESTVYNEAPFGRNQVTGEPAKMNTSEAMLTRFIDNGNGINYFTTANNHSYDYGEEGLLATLDMLDKYQVWHSGTNRSPEQQEDVLIIEQNGIKIAMLSYTFDLNGNKYDKKYLINEVRFNDETFEMDLIERHIAKAREKGADIIIACCHWGWEFEMYPHKNIIEAGHRLIEAGIDVILGDHPHVSQAMERYQCVRGGETVNGFIVYSYGDFVSYHPESRNSKITYATKFDIVKGTVNGVEKTLITNLKMLPIYILNQKISGDKYNCRLVKFKDVIADDKKILFHEYGLTSKERSELAHLNDVVLNQILLPENHDGLVAE